MIDYFLDFIITMRKQDISALISEYAKAELKYYDTHGYFSFWSDALKIQRIKERETLKMTEAE